MDPGAGVNGDTDPPSWWRWIRRVAIFGLGVAVVLEGILSPQDRIIELIAGLVMVGVLPLDDLWIAARRRR